MIFTIRIIRLYRIKINIALLHKGAKITTIEI